MKTPFTILVCLIVLCTYSCATLNGDPCKNYYPLTATSNSPVEAGQTIELSASELPSATYQWTGPNGFTSNDQNPGIYFPSMLDSGYYRVTATSDGCEEIHPAPAHVEIIYPDVPCNPSPENKLIFTGLVNSEQYGTLSYSNSDGFNHFSAYNLESDFSLCLWGDSLPAADNVYDIENSFCGDFIDGGHANITLTMFYYYNAASGNVYVKVFPDKITMTFCDVSFGSFNLSGTMVYYK